DGCGDGCGERCGVLIGGSTWRVEERMIKKLLESSFFQSYKYSWRVILAPHDISDRHLSRIRRLFGASLITLTELEEGTVITQTHRVLLIDRIGILASLYRFADIAFIGGGFGKGIHNILEPAAFSIPIVFGPNYHKFREAEALTGISAAVSVRDRQSFNRIIRQWLAEPEIRRKAGAAAHSWLQKQYGATALIMNDLLEKC
ncbi:MAG: hypothetical protein J7L89_06875, partial [Bacteroidales bacterium]|nr:hypothetical protein [Bacteroidales bacterium]